MVKAFVVASAAALAIGACNNAPAETTQNSVADDVAMDNTAMENGMAGGAITDAPASSMAFSAADAAFVTQTAKLNNYELKSAELAAKMGTAPAVKTLGAMITKHHTMAGEQLKKTVAEVSPSTTLPTGVDPKGQQRLDALKAAGSGFDALYKQQMIDSHAEIYASFANYGANAAANTMVRGVANGLNPIVRLHWDEATKL